MILYEVPELVLVAKNIAARKDLEWEKKWIAMSIKAREGIALPFDLTMSEEEMRERNYGDSVYIEGILSGASKETYERFGRMDYVYMKTQCPHCRDLAWGSISHLDMNNGWQTINKCRQCGTPFIAAYHPAQNRAKETLILAGIILIAIVILLTAK